MNRLLAAALLAAFLASGCGQPSDMGYPAPALTQAFLEAGEAPTPGTGTPGDNDPRTDPEEVVAPGRDYAAAAAPPLWYEDARSLDCSKAQRWCDSSQYKTDKATAEARAS